MEPNVTFPSSDPDGARPQDPLAYETRFWGRGLFWIAGVDEAGRGPLAGPVVAAAVVLPPGCHIPGATDSKALTPERREELNLEIRSRARAIGVGSACVREIDNLNILRATALAMDRAIRALPRPPEQILVDGLPVREVGWAHEAIVRGDCLVHSIACASIVAKVTRDRLMCRLAPRYPAYGWERNKGYGTPDHLQALMEFGRCAHHRKTFRPGQAQPEPEGKVKDESTSR